MRPCLATGGIRDTGILALNSGGTVSTVMAKIVIKSIDVVWTAATPGREWWYSDQVLVEIVLKLLAYLVMVMTV